MSTYITLRIIPGLLVLRHTGRGWRAGIGPRWARLWLGADGSGGVSTGAGPVTYYRPVRRARRRR